MTTENFKPLLATEVDFDLLDYDNLWVSPKLDGIRAIVIKSVVMSRKLLPIPNDEVQRLFGRPEFNGLDGELIVGSPTAKTVYQDTYSGVMKKTGKPDVTFFAFDHIGDPTLEYQRRYLEIDSCLEYGWPVTKLKQVAVHSYDDLLDVEDSFLDEGYEGVMLRTYKGDRSRYKFGRSTAKQGTLLKLKRFSDKEAEIIGVEEEMQNNNEATVDELGHTKRSSHQENKVGKGRLGALVCKTESGIEFRIGTGFSAADRQALWSRRDSLIGQLAKFKSFDIGVVDAPRFPVFLGLRSRIDT